MRWLLPPSLHTKFERISFSMSPSWAQGTLGTHFAIQAAAYGHRVSGFDPDRIAFQRMQTRGREAMRMTRKRPTFPMDEWDQHAAKVATHDNLAAALLTCRSCN